MKLLASIAAVLLAATACEKQPSKLDNVQAEMPAVSAAAPSGDLESRVRKLEQYTEALDFLQKVYDQQKQQQQAQADREPAPDAVFAVDISENLKLGQTEGPSTAPITIVEAWDFA